MYAITLTHLGEHSKSETTVTFADEHAPTLRSMVQELRESLAARMSGPRITLEQDAALTRSFVMAGHLAALTLTIGKRDPDYVSALPRPADEEVAA